MYVKLIALEKIMLIKEHFLDLKKIINTVNTESKNISSIAKNS